MAGMLQILTYLLAVYLIVKGIEVLQIALASSRTDRSGPIAVGVLTLIGCVIAALIFISWQDSQAHSLSTSFQSP
jgi:uncharacterized membrane protein HdeD (DUF308 family)